MKLSVIFSLLLLFFGLLAASSSEPDEQTVVGLPSLEFEGED